MTRDQLLEEFRLVLLALAGTRARAEDAAQAGMMTTSDLEGIYSGLFIQATNEFEAFTERLFFAIALGRVSYPRRRGVAARLSVRSAAVLRDVLHRGDDYIQWLPYGHTLGAAEAHLRGGRPFTSLTEAQKQSVKEWSVVRNSLAHHSDHAQRVFERKVIGNRAVPPRERMPRVFLRSTTRLNPPRTRLEVYFSEMLDVARSLTS